MSGIASAPSRIRVGVLGAGGRMGKEVCRAVAAAEDLELVAAVDPDAAGRKLADVVGEEMPPVVVGDLDGVSAAGASVVVDFTTPAAVPGNMAWCAANGVHAVVGTSGLSAEVLDELRPPFEESSANALVVPNFAIGAVLMMRMCEVAAPWMSGVEVIELHHDGKRDAPSGTAVGTVERIDAARRGAGSGAWTPDPTVTFSLPGARGAEGAGGVHVHSVRLPGLLAHQEVVFGSPGETLTIRHDSTDRVSFMPGVLLAVRRVASLPGMTIGLDAALGLP